MLTDMKLRTVNEPDFFHFPLKLAKINISLALIAFTVLGKIVSFMPGRVISTITTQSSIPTDGTMIEFWTW